MKVTLKSASLTLFSAFVLLVNGPTFAGQANVVGAKVSEPQIILVAANTSSSLPKLPTVDGSSIPLSVASLVPCGPTYPRDALQRGITGEFTVRMMVAPSGEVTNVSVVSGGPLEDFRRELKSSMGKCKFAPTNGGFIAEAPVVFTIND